MTGDTLMVGLIVVYVVLAVIFAFEGNWPRVLYWVSAGLITTSVLWMK